MWPAFPPQLMLIHSPEAASVGLTDVISYTHSCEALVSTPDMLPSNGPSDC